MHFAHISALEAFFLTIANAVGKYERTFFPSQKAEKGEKTFFNSSPTRIRTILAEIHLRDEIRVRPLVHDLPVKCRPLQCRIVGRAYFRLENGEPESVQSQRREKAEKGEGESERLFFAVGADGVGCQASKGSRRARASQRGGGEPSEQANPFVRARSPACLTEWQRWTLARLDLNYFNAQSTVNPLSSYCKDCLFCQVILEHNLTHAFPSPPLVFTFAAADSADALFRRGLEERPREKGERRGGEGRGLGPDRTNANASFFSFRGRPF